MIFISYMMIHLKNKCLLVEDLLGLQDENTEKETILIMIVESNTKPEIENKRSVIHQVK